MFDLSWDPNGSVHEISEEISINASVEKVWAVVSDIEHMPGMNPLMLSARWLNGAAEATIGARFSSQNLHKELGVWSATSEIVEYLPNEAIAWTIESVSSPAMVCRFDITESGSQTVLHQTYFIDPRPGMGPPLAQALRRRRRPRREAG